MFSLGTAFYPTTEVANIRWIVKKFHIMSKRRSLCHKVGILMGLAFWAPFGYPIGIVS
jgi:hypothetical protein